MERRARVRQTFPDCKSGHHNKSDYDVALGREFAAMSKHAENVVHDKAMTVQQKVRIRLMLDIHWTEMQACAVHRNAASLYRNISDTRSQ
eukprot:11185035-Karenia_brevis.AAC.1